MSLLHFRRIACLWLSDQILLLQVGHFYCKTAVSNPFLSSSSPSEWRQIGKGAPWEASTRTIQAEYDCDNWPRNYVTSIQQVQGSISRARSPVKQTIAPQPLSSIPHVPLSSKILRLFVDHHDLSVCVPRARMPCFCRMQPPHWGLFVAQESAERHTRRRSVGARAEVREILCNNI